MIPNTKRLLALLDGKYNLLISLQLCVVGTFYLLDMKRLEVRNNNNNNNFYFYFLLNF